MFGTWSCEDYIRVGKGELPIYNDLECPICLEVTRSISQPNCDHMVCINCFKRCYYGIERNNHPPFPYSDDIEDEYCDDPKNEKWDRDYPLISEWNKRWCRWDEACDREYKENKHLSKCPLCRR